MLGRVGGDGSESGQVGVVARGTHAELAAQMPDYEWSLAQE